MISSHVAGFNFYILLHNTTTAAVLFQLPESFHYTNDNRLYLAKVIEAFENFPVVIEFRHKEWIRQSVFEGLLQRKVSLAFCDMPELKNLPAAVVSCFDKLNNRSLRDHSTTAFVGANAMGLPPQRQPVKSEHRKTAVPKDLVTDQKGGYGNEEESDRTGYDPGSQRIHAGP